MTLAPDCVRLISHLFYYLRQGGCFSRRSSGWLEVILFWWESVQCLADKKVPKISEIPLKTVARLFFLKMNKSYFFQFFADYSESNTRIGCGVKILRNFQKIKIKSKSNIELDSDSLALILSDVEYPYPDPGYRLGNLSKFRQGLRLCCSSHRGLDRYYCEFPHINHCFCELCFNHTLIIWDH